MAERLRRELVARALPHVEQADRALYRSKENGRNCVTVLMCEEIGRDVAAA